ncbi:MAG TPA: flagellar hook-basal body protein [Bryobacteraceae bacterium]|nr:flagellar hook-basal body protein [Bryobacteraceae bacterium]
MDAISISAASGMRSRLQSLDLLANNLANVETGGYKADREFYSVYSSAEADAADRNEIAELPVIQKQWTDLSPGSLEPTYNQFDLAVDGDGMFAIRTAHGIRYTRNGSFRLSPAGVLTTADGSPVGSVTGQPITLERNVPFSVAPDGTVQQAGGDVGRIRIQSFDATSLAREGGSYFVPVAGAAPKAAVGSIVQGKIERSNVSAAESAVRLVEITRQFEMLQKAATIGGELNQKAIEEVARVVS